MVPDSIVVRLNDFLDSTMVQKQYTFRRIVLSNFADLFIYFWLYWISVACVGFLILASRSYSFTVVRGLLISVACCRAQALGAQVTEGDTGLSSFWHSALVVLHMWESHWARDWSCASGLADRFLTTRAPGKPFLGILNFGSFPNLVICGMLLYCDAGQHLGTWVFIILEFIS